MNASETFEAERQRLFAIAYRLMGTVSDAEDVVQEAWLRWQDADQAAIDRPGAWLATVVTRLGIDALRKVKRRREAYVGPWLPEPLVETAEPSLAGTPPADPEETLALADDVSIALLTVLEALGPEERAAFLMHETFDVGYGDLAAMLGKSEAACRQIVSRAKRRVRAERPRFAAPPAAHERLIKAFTAAAASGDIAAISDLMLEDVVMVSDGGDKARAARRPLKGKEEVMHFLLYAFDKNVAKDLTLEQRLVNGLPGLVMFHEGKPFAVVSMEIEDDRVAVFYVVRNPDKMAGLVPGS